MTSFGFEAGGFRDPELVGRVESRLRPFGRLWWMGLEVLVHLHLPCLV